MSRYIIALVALIIFPLSSVLSAATRTVPGTATGKYFDDFENSWSKEPISVYVDDNANIYVKGGKGLLKSAGCIEKSDYKPVLDLFKKSIEWSEKAKANELEITKELGTFFRGDIYAKQGIGLKFFSANKGQQTDVILEIKDFSSPIFSIILYVEPDEMAKLIAIFEKIPETYKELKEQLEKSSVLE